MIVPVLLALAAATPPQDPLPQFEVASVRPIDLKARNAIDIKVTPSGRMIVTAASVLQLIAGAYGGLEMYQVIGPPWISSEAFNIDAEPPENDYGQLPTVKVLGRQVPEKTALRLRALLIARFQLRTHFETRDRTAYDLVIAKGGPKLKPADASKKWNGGLMQGGGKIVAESCSMAWLADRLARMVLRTDVTDKTGLTGVYDFQLEFAPTGPFAPASADSDVSSAPSLFTAVQALGLKLEAHKRPIQVVVVDHVEKPSAN